MNRRILIIDDEINILELYKEFLMPDLGITISTESSTPKGLNAEAFEVTTANHGQAGVEWVKQSMETKTPFAVAFIDMRMPPGWNGLKTARAIREIDKRIFIVIITGYRDHSIDQIQDVLKYDVFFLSKPSCKDEIYQMARSLCLRWERDFESDNSIISMNLDDTHIPIKNSSPGIIRIAGMTDKAKDLLNNKEYIIKKFPFKIGRDNPEKSDKMLSDSGLLIDDPVSYNVSKNHLLINYYENRYYILDCGSHLGTIVNGEQIGKKTARYKSILTEGKNTIIIGFESSPYKFIITLPEE